MGSSKISPPVFLSASLLYFTTLQHSLGSAGLVLSQHIFVMVSFRLTGGPQVQTSVSGRMEMVIGQCKAFILVVCYLWGVLHKSQWIDDRHIGVIIRTWHPVNKEELATGFSFCFMHAHIFSQPAWKWSKVLLLCNCRAQLSSVVRQEEPSREAPRVIMKTRFGSHMAAEKQTWSRRKPSSTARLPRLFSALTKRFLLLQPRSFISVDFGSTKTVLPLFAKSNLY